MAQIVFPPSNQLLLARHTDNSLEWRVWHTHLASYYRPTLHHKIAGSGAYGAPMLDNGLRSETDRPAPYRIPLSIPLTTARSLHRTPPGPSQVPFPTVMFSRYSTRNSREMTME